MAEAELERGLRDAHVGLEAKPRAHCVEAQVAQELHGCNAAVAMAQRVEGANADAGDAGQVVERDRRAQAGLHVLDNGLDALRTLGPRQAVVVARRLHDRARRGQAEGGGLVRQQEQRHVALEVVEPGRVQRRSLRHRHHVQKRLREDLPLLAEGARQEESRRQLEVLAFGAGADFAQQGVGHLEDELLRARVPAQANRLARRQHRDPSLGDLEPAAVGLDLRGAGERRVHDREVVEGPRRHLDLGAVLQHVHAKLAERALPHGGVDRAVLPAQHVIDQFLRDVVVRFRPLA